MNPTNKKIRPDAKLKRLPEERQRAISDYAAEHSLTQTAAWLRQDGLSVSPASVSDFLKFWRVREQALRNEQTVEAILHDLKESAHLKDEQLEVAGNLFFGALTIQNQDPIGWARVQDAKAKLQLSKLNRQKFQWETAELVLKWANDERTKEIAARSGPNAEKIELLGQFMFGENWRP